MIKKNKPKKKLKRWHLVTNHQNMLFMLAAGMVMAPIGFKNNYYTDPLSTLPGQIPLFWDKIKIPTNAFTQTTSERKNLVACIASFELNSLSGPIRVLSANGKIREETFSSLRKRKNDLAILVDAPLPLNSMLSISFQCSEDMQTFERIAYNVSNVDLSSQQINIDNSLFESNTKLIWPLSIQSQSRLFEYSTEHQYSFAIALGGVLAMLYFSANRSELGLATYKLASGVGSEHDYELIKEDPILSELPNWLQDGKITQNADTPTRLFWDIAKEIIIEKERERPQPLINIVLEYMDRQKANIQEEVIQTRLDRLITEIQDSQGLGSGTITEIFERNRDSLSRALLLFSLREHCADLIKFIHPMLNSAEYILASVLFGIRDGWLQLPHELRKHNLSKYITYKMSEYEHRKQMSAISMKALPRPIPLRELLVEPDGNMTKVQKKVAFWIIRECKWNNCIQTRITLSEDKYPESFQRKDLCVILPGEVKVEEEVIVDSFLNCLGLWVSIDSAIESKIRNMLGDTGKENNERR